MQHAAAGSEPHCAPPRLQQTHEGSHSSKRRRVACVVVSGAAHHAASPSSARCASENQEGAARELPSLKRRAKEAYRALPDPPLPATPLSLPGRFGGRSIASGPSSSLRARPKRTGHLSNSRTQKPSIAPGASGVAGGATLYRPTSSTSSPAESSQAPSQRSTASSAAAAPSVLGRGGRGRLPPETRNRTLSTRHARCWSPGT